MRVEQALLRPDLAFGSFEEFLCTYEQKIKKWRNSHWTSTRKKPFPKSNGHGAHKASGCAAGGPCHSTGELGKRKAKPYRVVTVSCRSRICMSRLPAFVLGFHKGVQFAKPFP